MRNATAFHVSLVGRTNLSQEIYQQIRSAILEGRIRPGDRLSPSRELARDLEVSRMTVTVAYERLAGDGFISSRQGAGTFVSETVLRSARPASQPRPRGVLQPRELWQTLGSPYVFDRAFRFDFRMGLPDASLFPHRAWQRSVMRALAGDETALGVYQEPAGHRALRSAIARQLGFSRGVKATADEIIIANGTQQALDLLARVLLAPGDTLAVEDPGYGVPRALFNALGLRVVGVPVDREGLVVEALPREARAVYVTPSHQFPLGMTMTLPRRRALLAWAKRVGAAIIEDDYDSEFRFDERPCEPLQTLDTEGRVVYIGTFSKTLLPTLRVGFLMTPPSLFAALRAAKFLADWQTPTLEQAAVARFMEDGEFARHLRKMTRVYRERRELMLETLARDFADHLELVPSSTGLHFSALARRVTPDELAAIRRRAAERGVAFQSLWGTSPRAGIAFGYGAIPTARIKEGLRLLRGCFEAKRG